MGLGVGLFQKGQPGFLRMRTLSEVQSATVGLVDLAVGLVRVGTLDVIKQDPVKEAFVVVGFNLDFSLA